MKRAFQQDMDRLLSDVRFTLRALARRPGFALVAVLTLAVGIGANTAVYSIAEAVLLRPLPFREPERLVLVWEKNVIRDRTRNVVNPGNYLEWRDRNRVFESLAAFSSFNMNLSGGEEPARVETGGVTANFFATLGVSPALGRAFLADDARPGAPDVVLLSDGLWRRRFGADPAVVGRDLMLNGQPTTVVGVMPAGFQVPPGVELWVPFTEGGSGGLRRDHRGRFLVTVARLKPEVSVPQAQAAMEGIAAQLETERPDFDTGWSVLVASLHADLVREAKPAVLVLFGAVALLLLIACGNLANLLLVRSLARGREIAIRRALGATPGRLVGQLFTESVVLAVMGGALGLLFAAWLKQGLLTIVPAEVQALFAVRLDPKVAAFALGLSVLSALVFGLAPAWQAVDRERASALHEGAAGTGLSRGRRRFTRFVVAGEVALSLVLLAGAGLLLRSFWRLSNENAGFDPTRVLSLQVNLSGPRYREDEAQTRFYEDAVGRIAALPGVESAAAVSWRPLGAGSATSFIVPDRPAPAAGQEPVADVRMVTPSLFRTLGIPLRAGRDFDEGDRVGRPRVVVVNERLAREFWPGQSALGRKIKMEWDAMQEAEIVGVVGDVRLVGLEQAPRATLYWPIAQLPNSFASFLVKTKEGPAALAPSIKAALASVDPALPVARIAALDAVVHDSLQQPRFTSVLIGAFALTAALLAALGLFGLLSYSVAQRLPEMGIRLTLGAQPVDIAGLILREGALLAAAGAAAGLLGALALSALLTHLLYETSPRDPLAFAAVVAFVALLAFAAAALPARRASRVHPAVALRSE
jgi:putative ABC transport system permease protein